MWEQDFTIVHDVDQNSFRKWFRESYPGFEPASSIHSDGGYMVVENKRDGGSDHVIWLEDSSDIPVLTHELFHMMANVMRVMGINFCEETEEVYNYYHTRLLRDSIRELDKANDKKNKE